MNMNHNLTVLSLFDGVSIARQVLKEIGYADNINYFASEIDKYAISVSKYKHRDIVHIGGVKDVSFTVDPNSTQGFLHTIEYRTDNDYVKQQDIKLQLPYKDTLHDIVDGTDFHKNVQSLAQGYEVDLMIGGSPCFAAGTLIYTEVGSKPLENIKEGDTVMTHLGNWKKVLKVGGSKKEILSIWGSNKFGCNQIFLNTTSEHPIYVLITIVDCDTDNIISQELDWVLAKNLKTTHVNGTIKYYALTSPKQCRLEKNINATTFNDYYIFPVTNVYADASRIEPVFNLEVEDDNSYLADGICVHNCQDLSVAKQNRQGLAGNKSSLFYEYLRILKETKPKYFILENVASMKKEDMETITRELFIEPLDKDWQLNRELGKPLKRFQTPNDKYKQTYIQYKSDYSNLKQVGCSMINASLVSAQSRKRLFWVGKWNNETQWYDWIDIPQPEDRHIYLKDVLLPLSQIDEKYILSGRELNYMNANTTGNYSSRWGNSHCSDNDKSQAMVSNLSKGVPYNVLKDNRELQFLGGVGNKDIVGDGKPLSRNIPQGNRVYGVEGKNCTLSANGGGLGHRTGLILQEGKGGALRTRDTTAGSHKVLETRQDEKSNNLTTVYTDSLAVLYNPKLNDKKAHTEKSCALLASHYKEPPVISKAHIIRKLHPIETERLQSLEDNYTLIGLQPNKKTGVLEEVIISDNQRYKMMGNGFNCEVIKHILRQLDLTKNN